MSEAVAPTVGWVGDGDEIDALADVESAFGIKLDYSDSTSWHTAGEVYDALLRELPPEAASDPKTWQRFVSIITDEGGVDPSIIERASPLFHPATKGWARIANPAAAFFLFVVVVILVAAVVVVAK